MAKANSLDTTVLDGASLFSAVEAIGDRFSRSRITLDYSKLRQRLDDCRLHARWRPACLNTMLLSLDPASEGQQRFTSMLEHSGIEPDVVHYRNAFVSLPPGKSPAESVAKSQVSLCARIAYICGLMVQHPDSHFLVVSHSFELCDPLSDLARRIGRHGKVGLAYFGSLLDYRWKATGVLDEQGGVEFFDLDNWGEDLLGVELIGRPDTRGGDRAGLARF